MSLIDLPLARAVHVLAVVLWIGGVAMVTTVLLPAVQREVEPARRVDFFESIEARFAWQSRVTTLLAGASGFYLAWRLDLWSRFQAPEFWWMHAMVGLWLVFTLMLFVLEPLVLHRWFHERAARAPEATFRLVSTLHRVLLAASLVTVAGAVAGSHGLF
jgi:uncharacterized membrane protein